MDSKVKSSVQFHTGACLVIAVLLTGAILTLKRGVNILIWELYADETPGVSY